MKILSGEKYLHLLNLRIAFFPIGLFFFIKNTTRKETIEKKRSLFRQKNRKNLSKSSYCLCADYFIRLHAGIILEPTLLGQWVEGCGVKFLVPNLEVNKIKIFIQKAVKIFFQATWSEAQQFCCKLGMSLVTIYSIDKQYCLFDSMNGYFNLTSTLTQIEINFKGTMPYDVKFWTSATDQYCPGKFRLIIYFKFNYKIGMHSNKKVVHVRREGFSQG